MPPALFPRSIQVARLLKGLRGLGWSTSVVTPTLESLAPADTIDRELGELYGDCYVLVPIDLSTADREGGASWRQVVEWWRGETDKTPDQLWVMRASRATDHLLRRPAAALITFAQPWRDHLVGLEVAKRRPRLQWIAHFSDPWVDSLYDADAIDELKAIERAREAAVVERANAVVFTNAYAADLVMKKYPAAWRSKAFVVPHSMDPDLLAAADRLVPPRAEPRPLRLAHVGNLFVGLRTANAVFEAIARLHRERNLEGRLEFVLVGEGSGLYEARCRVFELALESIVAFRSRASHVESLAAMRDSDFLILLDAAAETNVFLPSKIVDYLMVQRPILGITPSRGASAEVLEARGHLVVAPGDVAAIAGAIAARLQAHESGTTVPVASASDGQFSLDTTTRQFAAILEKLTGRDR
jgi:glycosyltransferase involved in cell wall biosynthesis